MQLHAFIMLVAQSGLSATIICRLKRHWHELTNRQLLPARTTAAALPGQLELHATCVV